MGRKKGKKCGDEDEFYNREAAKGVGKPRFYVLLDA